MGHKSRVHNSKFKGAARHGGGKLAPVGHREGSFQQPKVYGRYARYEGAAVPQNPENRTPQQQLEYLDLMGYKATKERAKLNKRIEDIE